MKLKDLLSITNKTTNVLVYDISNAVLVYEGKVQYFNFDDLELEVSEIYSEIISAEIGVDIILKLLSNKQINAELNDIVDSQMVVFCKLIEE